MGGAVVRWVKFVVPLVVHSASKVRLRAAATMEMGMPLLLEKQTEVAAVIEPMMSSVSCFIFYVGDQCRRVAKHGTLLYRPALFILI